MEAAISFWGKGLVVWVRSQAAVTQTTETVNVALLPWIRVALTVQLSLAAFTVNGALV